MLAGGKARPDLGPFFYEPTVLKDVPEEAVVAFGNMPNDMDMLQLSTWGVAVENAHHAVLAAADEVTASNDDDGVALVMERLLAE